MSMAHIITKQYRDVPSWGSHWGSPSSSETVHSWPRLSLYSTSGELAPSLITGSTWESGTCPLPKQHRGPGLSDRGVGELAPRV